MKNRFLSVNTRSDQFRCTTREGMATSFAGAVSKGKKARVLLIELGGGFQDSMATAFKALAASTFRKTLPMGLGKKGILRFKSRQNLPIQES
jgi:hypothetical protein